MTLQMIVRKNRKGGVQKWHFCRPQKKKSQLGWDVPDFVLVTGDAYVDHPTFGVAIISRLLESYSYKIAILAQPDWRTDRDFTRFDSRN